MALVSRTRDSRRSSAVVAQRDGAYLVELAVVVTIFVTFLFGILEYSRLIYVRQMMVNAAREGSRYAVANVTDSSVVTDTKNVVKGKMCGLDKNTTYYNCDVFKANSSGTSTGSASDAAFGEYIAVQIDYDYAPCVPNFLKLNSSFRITVRDLMFSEAN